jgi:hypothetical protein
MKASTLALLLVVLNYRKEEMAAQAKDLEAAAAAN